MLLTVLALGGAILGATTIAGLLMVYQIRQSGDLVGSQRAIYAADAGLEWGLYQFFKSGDAAPAFTNGAQVTLSCYTDGTYATGIACNSTSATVMVSKGTFRSLNRAFELNF